MVSMCLVGCVFFQLFSHDTEITSLLVGSHAMIPNTLHGVSRKNNTTTPSSEPFTSCTIHLGRHKANLECQTIVRDMSQRLWGTCSKQTYEDFTNKGEGSTSTTASSSSAPIQDANKVVQAMERSLLIGGPAESGKTMVLREFAKVLGHVDGFFHLKVFVLDSIGELVPCVKDSEDAVMSNATCDGDGSGKEGITYIRIPNNTSREDALRDLSYKNEMDILLLDNVTSLEEVNLLKGFIQNGVAVICTMLNAANVNDVVAHPVFSNLVTNTPSAAGAEELPKDLFVIDRGISNVKVQFRSALFLEMEHKVTNDGKSCHYVAVSDLQENWNRRRHEEERRESGKLKEAQQQGKEFLSRQATNNEDETKKKQGKSTRMLKNTRRQRESNNGDRRRSYCPPRNNDRNERRRMTFTPRSRNQRDSQVSRSRQFHHNPREGRREGFHGDIRHDGRSSYRYQNPRPHYPRQNGRITQNRHREQNRQIRRDSIVTRGRSNRDIFLRRKRNSQGPLAAPSSTKGGPPIPDFVISTISPLVPDGVYSFSVTMR